MGSVGGFFFGGGGGDTTAIVLLFHQLITTPQVTNNKATHDDKNKKKHDATHTPATHTHIFAIARRAVLGRAGLLQPRPPSRGRRRLSLVDCGGGWVR